MSGDALVTALLAAPHDGDVTSAGWWRVATVTGTGPLLVQLAGSADLPASHLDTYTPTGGDVVLVAQVGDDFIVLGAITGG